MKPRMHRPFSPLPQRQRGAVIVLIAVAMLAIVAMAALALDGGHMLVNKSRLQNAVDAAALSGAKTLSQVMGSGNASSLTRDAAHATFELNAGVDGNQELADAMGESAAGFVVVELSASVYGPFSFPGPADARYVRVSVANYALSEFFWGILQAIGDGNFPDKAVAAIATAGPSPSAAPCDLAPVMVCGDPATGQYDPEAGLFWGYQFGEVEVLKESAGSDPVIGPGNFQLIDLDGSGKNDVRDALAGGIEKCLGPTVETEPGAGSGPTAQGLNTRFGIYHPGNMSSTLYPADWVPTANDPGLQAEDDGTVTHDELEVTSDNGDLSTSDSALYDYNNWVSDSAACTGCDGEFERRILKIVVGDCTGASGGKQTLPILGYGCFFVLQPVSHSQGGGGGNSGEGGGGNPAKIIGQFIEQCEGDGVAGPTPVEDVGPQIIQLYKTYIDGEPSKDS